MIWFIRRVWPKALVPSATRVMRLMMSVFLFICIFLILFIILGCTSTSSTYSSVYSTRFTAGLAKNGTFEVQASYYGICVKTDSAIACSSANNVTALSIYRNETTSSGATVDLISLGELVAKDLIHPVLPIMSLVFVVLAFFANSARCVVVESESIVASSLNTATLWTSILGTLIWGMGVTWNHSVSKALERSMYDSTSGVINAIKGDKMDSMGWAAFSFQILVMIGTVTSVAWDARNLAQRARNAEMESNSYSMPTIGRMYTEESEKTNPQPNA
ncbi:Ca2+ regulator and membrane fusion protein Fig1-domain-containing protein [Dipodascopsis uninucleata]